jgi:hypothetical protein
VLVSGCLEGSGAARRFVQLGAVAIRLTRGGGFACCVGMAAQVAGSRASGRPQLKVVREKAVLVAVTIPGQYIEVEPQSIVIV